LHGHVLRRRSRQDHREAAVDGSAVPLGDARLANGQIRRAGGRRNGSRREGREAPLPIVVLRAAQVDVGADREASGGTLPCPVGSTLRPVANERVTTRACLNSGLTVALTIELHRCHRPIAVGHAIGRKRQVAALGDRVRVVAQPTDGRGLIRGDTGNDDLHSHLVAKGRAYPAGGVGAIHLPSFLVRARQRRSCQVQTEGVFLARSDCTA